MIKDLLPRQVVCSNKDEKGKPCHGGLKRYYPLAGYYNETSSDLRDEIVGEFGQRTDLVLLKCETCNCVYRLPDTLQKKWGTA